MMPGSRLQPENRANEIENALFWQPLPSGAKDNVGIRAAQAICRETVRFAGVICRKNVGPKI
jgi:hypothetical protein